MGITDIPATEAFLPTLGQGKKANIDYWEFIKLSKGERISANIDSDKVCTQERIAYIRNRFERGVPTKAIAKHFDCSEAVIRRHANTNGIHRKTYRIKFVRVGFQYAPQTVDPTRSSCINNGLTCHPEACYSCG